MVDTTDLKSVLGELGIGSSPIVSKYNIYSKSIKREEKLLKKMIYKKRKILNIGFYLYGIKTQILSINCDKLLFLKKYKNIYDLIHLNINDVRIYPLIFKLLRFRIDCIKYNLKKKKDLTKYKQKWLITRRLTQRLKEIHEEQEKNIINMRNQNNMYTKNKNNINIINKNLVENKKQESSEKNILSNKIEAKKVINRKILNINKKHNKIKELKKWENLKDEEFGKEIGLDKNIHGKWWEN